MFQIGGVSSHKVARVSFWFYATREVNCKQNNTRVSSHSNVAVHNRTRNIGLVLKRVAIGESKVNLIELAFIPPRLADRVLTRRHHAKEIGLAFLRCTKCAQ